MIACVLASTVAYRPLIVSTRDAIVAFRSSPMLLAREDAGDGCWSGSVGWSGRFGG